VTPKTQRTLFLVAALSISGSALAVIATGNMGKNLVYYWSPSEMRDAGPKAIGATIRLGGQVKSGTVDWKPAENQLQFVVTDGTSEVNVHATHAPPEMFREGMGVVVEGTMTQAGVFETDRLMVKHNNEYRAPGTPGAQAGATVEDLYKTVADAPK
jgi:cytochrome c-type biogenesis protein CcmE